MSDILAVYVDGGVIVSNPSIIGGTWACRFVSKNDEVIRETSGLILPGGMMPNAIGNNLSELCALILGLSAVPDGWSGHIYSDSKNTLGRFFLDYAMNGVPQFVIDNMNHIKKRINVKNCKYTLLDGHPTKAQLESGIGKRGNPVSHHNVWCDKECNRIANEYLTRHRKSDSFFIEQFETGEQQ